MSLYREARSRSLWPFSLVALVAAAIGLAIGLLLGGSGEPSLSEALEPVHEDVRAAQSSLELVPIEYEQGQGSGPAAAATEDEAAQEHLNRARESFEQAEPDLILINPAGTAAAVEAFDALDAAIADRAPASEVERLTLEAASALNTAAGLEDESAGS